MVFLAAVWLVAVPVIAKAGRQVISLDGSWELAEGGPGKVPDQFTHRVPVPGLVDLAKPPFPEVGQKSVLRESFWYRRVFRISGEIPPVAQLKIHKAAYGSKVFLNRAPLGEHWGSFTPGYFDVWPVLHGGGATNELLICIGASRDSVPSSVPSGFDFEKVRYIPGIFDSVELILAGSPQIVRCQVAPDIARGQIRVQALLRATGPGVDARVTYKVRETRSGALVAKGGPLPVDLPADGEYLVETCIAIPHARLWSPEDPFLYSLELSTGADELQTRFGMREFRLDHDTGRAMLNGRPYFLRGSNVTLYRFFEDPGCGDHPWREAWVRRLHRQFKSMHWNSLRYCIGFPPEMWYRIADEEGILIQDEFPIWQGSRWPADWKSPELVREYTEWMQERWNHPCVVIWDAQNETVTEETGKAIQEVRQLDLSNRPWDNGYGKPGSPGDVYESHPYLFNRSQFKLSGVARLSPVPRGNNRSNLDHNPIIINEYDWLWLNRDGSPTTLSKKVYDNLLGANATATQRWHLNASYQAALTEFWRAHRACAGVLHFCGLGYSRTNGQTCDNFINLDRLKFEPEFQRYMSDAFSPVGLMIDEWRAELPADSQLNVPVLVINDLDQDWTGQVRLSLRQGKRVVASQTQPCRVAAYGTNQLFFPSRLPKQRGNYQLEASLWPFGRKPVRSLRDVRIGAEDVGEAAGIAQGKQVIASSVYHEAGNDYAAENAVDGRLDTRWSSAFSDPQWLAIDLGSPVALSRVTLNWEVAYAKRYAIQVSADGQNWIDVYTTANGLGGMEEIKLPITSARWIRFYGIERATPFGYSLWEMKVFP